MKWRSSCGGLTSLLLEKYSLPGLTGKTMMGRVVLLSISILFFPLSGRPQRTPDPRTADQTKPPLALIEKAQDERSAGNFAQAAELFKEAERRSIALNGQRDRALCSMSLGLTSWDLGEILESSRHFAEAAALYHKQKQTELEDLCGKGLEIIRLYNLGKQKHSQERDSESVDYFDKAINIGRQMGIDDFELKCRRLQSLSYWEMGDIGMFFACNKRALEIARHLNHRREIGRCLNNIGIYYSKIGDCSNALRNYEVALPLLHKEVDLYTEAGCINNIAIIYRNVGELNKALSKMADALGIDEQLGDPKAILEDHGNLGAMYLHRGWINGNREDIGIALGEFNKCIKGLRASPDSKLEFMALNNIGFAYSLIQEYDRALEILEEALTKKARNLTSEEHCHLLNNIAASYLGKGDIEEALSYYARSVGIIKKNKNLEVLWEAYFGLGRCYEVMKDLHTALEYFIKSIEAMEQLRRGISLDPFKISFARSKFAVYQHALDILYSFYAASPTVAHLDGVFRIIERAKARAFLEGLSVSSGEDASKDSPEMVLRERELSREITILNKNARKPGQSKAERNASLRQLEEKEDEHMRVLASLRAGKSDSRGSPPFRDISVSDVQTALVDGRTALLEYLISENRSYLLLITRQNAQLYTLAGKGELERSLRGYLKSLTSSASSSFGGVPAAERIGKDLLSSLKKDLPPGIDTLIIIPDGILNYLPFETLRLNAAGEAKYLIEDYRVSYCPSSAAFLLLKQKPRADSRAKALLAFGAPDYGPSALSEDDTGVNHREFMTDPYLGPDNFLPSLPFSKEEVLGIARHFPVSQSDVFLGKQANETTIKSLPLSDYRIIHIACHAILDDRLPFRSALAFSQDAGKEEDGFLQVREIYSLKLNADLIVLSACQTGNGALEKAEGLVGLTRSFFHAGAKSVLSAIWSINDRTTALLMERFYSCMAKGQDKSSALREAKLAMLKSPHSHPYYWAGFVLNGDPAPIRFNDEPARRLN